MKLRQTHTLATLPISREAYIEIANKLLAAGYGQSFLIRGHWKNLKEEIENGRATIDMHGVGLVLEQEENKKCIVCGKEDYPLDVKKEVCIICGIKPNEEIEVKEELSKKDKNYHITETEVDFNVVFPEGKDF